MLKYGGSEIRVLAWADTGHDADIFCCLILQDKHSIVYCYNSHQAVLMINNGNRNKAVFVDHIRHILLIIQSPRIKHILIHNLFNQSGFSCCKKILHIHNTDQFFLFCHVTGIDRLLVDTYLPDFQNRIRHSHLSAQADVLYIHNAARTVFRILQKRIDLLSRFLISRHQQTVYHISRHLFQDVNRVVYIHLVHDFFQF